MAWKQMSFEEDSINRIRSHYSTLHRYHQTSMALHGRPVEATYLLAEQLGEQVAGIREANPDSTAVGRWADKFESMVNELGLKRAE